MTKNFKELYDISVSLGEEAIEVVNPTRVCIELEYGRRLFFPEQTTRVRFRASSALAKPPSEAALGVAVLDAAGELVHEPKQRVLRRREDGYEEAETLGPLEGFWVHFLHPDSISVSGREIQDDTTLWLAQPGWHLISSPFSIDWERVLVFVNGVERYVDEDAARPVIDDFCACYDPEGQVYRVSDELLPCQGYWIRTHEPNVQLKFE